MADENSKVERRARSHSTGPERILTRPRTLLARWRRPGPLVLIGVSILIGFLFLRPYLSPEVLQQSIEEWGVWGPLGFVLCYGVATVLMFPGASFTLVGGFLFGPIWGTFFSLAGATIGATLAFLVARYLGGDWVSRKFEERLPTMQESIGQDGWKYVMVTRLVPLFPFNLLNYAFGLTSIRLLPYVLATFLFIIPGAFAYTHLGYATRTIVDGVTSGASIKQVVGVASTAVGLLAIVWLVRKMWAQRPGHECHQTEHVN